MTESVIDTIRTMVKGEITQQKVQTMYRQWSETFDKDLFSLKHTGCVEAAKAVKEHCPGNPDNTKILDVGSGTGLVGEELAKLGFQYIDGVDPSIEMLEKAKTKGVYRNLFCEFFTEDSMNIPADTYDVIVTCGTFVQHHLPYNCLYEIIRLVKPAGRVCIVGRSSSFNEEDEYGRHLLSLMNDLERNKKWKRLEKKELPEYNVETEGCVVVYEIY